MKRGAIGVDIGGGSVKVGFVSRGGKVLMRDSFATPDDGGRRRLLGQLVRTVRAMRQMARRRGYRVTGVGIGAPGPIDVDKGFVYFFPNIKGWKNTSLRSLLERRLGLPVRVDNDANVAALAESRYGAGRGARDLVVLTLGTGVGGGLILGGRLHHGCSFSASEIGHLVVDETGPRCACGNRGCIETFVGSGYFVRELRKRLRERRGALRTWTRRYGEAMTPLLAARAARAGDAVTRRLWRETGRRLGTYLAGLVNILNPEKIILGGGIAQNRNLLFDPLKKALRKKAFPIASRSVRVVPAALGLDAGIIGAASLIFEDLH